MRKKIIGVMPLWDDEKESLWMLPGYLDGIAEAGGLPIIFPLTTEKDDILRLCTLCDGFLFTGGHDVTPEVYGEKAIPETVSCKRRDDMEAVVLDYAIERDKAVLGICRGIQFINAHLGGTLYQDLEAQHPSNIDHHMTPPYDKVQHTVKISEKSALYELLGESEIGVNSYHHQAIRTLSSKLSAMAEASDGIIEAVRMKDMRFIWAVQWHPEFSHKTDERSRKIFSELIKNAI